MPSVTCPGCEKKYNLPATAAGQVANCKCGKKFRVGGASAEAKPKPAVATASAAKPAAPQPAARAVAPAARVAAPAKPAAPKPVAAVATPTRVEAPKPKPKQDDSFWDDVDKPLADLELEPVEATSRPASAFRPKTPAPVQAPQQNIVMRMWHSRARKLLMGPPIAVLGVIILVSKFNSGERIPRGGFFLVAIGVGITWAGLTGESE
ncbi:hypothetical protein [Lacipirellula parvula]|uniref:Uncharacterized protein n=1 Tax=Lacipirellula parvula TaxID=2650471 RepID=A0A5K7X4Z1_9BACT|nr:hypothetical protein [Lacipirellula parvula]BBO31754.1 hypothetical protein PLANPX_1366 [Lacipirellula parvula]